MIGMSFQGERRGSGESGPPPEVERRAGERRRYPRSPLALVGRYMLENGQEYPCRSEDVSAVGVAITGPHKAALGEKVVAYFDRLGRVEGFTRRYTPVGFAIEVSGGPLKVQRVGERIQQILTSAEAAPQAEAGHAEAGADARKRVMLTTPAGEVPAELVGLTLESAEAYFDDPPPVGTPVAIGRRRGVVTKTFPGGASIRFARAEKP